MGSNINTGDRYGARATQTKMVYVAVTCVCWIMYIAAICIGICRPRHDDDNVVDKATTTAQDVVHVCVDSSMNQESSLYTPNTNQQPLNTLATTDDDTPCLW